MKNGILSCLVVFGLVLVPLSGLQQPGTITAADTAALNATDEILKSVSKLRDLEVKESIKRALRSRDEIELAVMKDMDESTRPEEFAATEKTLLKFGLIPPGFKLRDYTIKLLREQVAGFYAPKTKEFYLAAWLPLSEQKTVIAHELVHALQDQHFNLRRLENWPKGDSDAQLAAHALVEGEATMVMYQFAFEQEGRKIDLTQLASITERLLDMPDDVDRTRYPVMAAAPTVMKDSLQFPYVFGVGFVQEILKHGSWSTLNSAYKDFPDSTEQIIHPSRFINRDRPVRIEIKDLATQLGRDWSKIDTDVNGEFGYQLLLAQFLGRPASRPVAAGWGGDRYVLYENKTSGRLLLAQFTTWDTASDATEFFRGYCSRTEKRYKGAQPLAQGPGHLLYETPEGLVSVEVRGTDVVVLEGAENRNQLSRLATDLWQSQKVGR